MLSIFIYIASYLLILSTKSKHEIKDYLVLFILFTQIFLIYIYSCGLLEDMLMYLSIVCFTDVLLCILIVDMNNHNYLISGFGTLLLISLFYQFIFLFYINFYNPYFLFISGHYIEILFCLFNISRYRNILLIIILTIPQIINYT